VLPKQERVRNSREKTGSRRYDVWLWREKNLANISGYEGCHHRSRRRFDQKVTVRVLAHIISSRVGKENAPFNNNNNMED
jgi:hypothetical protein